MSIQVHFTLSSSNAKTGAIPVSTTSANTCPDSCPLKFGGGCYANGGPLGMHWRKVTDGKRGSGWEDFRRAVASLPQGQLWRHNQAGDLPGENDRISVPMLEDLVRANKGRRGFTYTHKPVLDRQRGEVVENREAIAKANREGFTINLSANGLKHADELAALKIAPVVTLLPSGIEDNTTTPNGRKVVVCPAQKIDGITCAKCRLCARADRSVIIGFIPHGNAKRKTGAVADKN
jgi:hypothetical protein